MAADSRCSLTTTTYWPTVRHLVDVVVGNRNLKNKCHGLPNEVCTDPGYANPVAAIHQRATQYVESSRAEMQKRLTNPNYDKAVQAQAGKFITAAQKYWKTTDAPYTDSKSIMRFIPDVGGWFGGPDYCGFVNAMLQGKNLVCVEGDVCDKIKEEVAGIKSAPAAVAKPVAAQPAAAQPAAAPVAATPAAASAAPAAPVKPGAPVAAEPQESPTDDSVPVKPKRKQPKPAAAKPQNTPAPSQRSSRMPEGA